MSIGKAQVAPSPPALSLLTPFENPNEFSPVNTTTMAQGQENLEQKKPPGKASRKMSNFGAGSFFRDSLTPPGLMSSHSEFQEVWDLIQLSAMLYIVFITPYDCAFLSTAAITDLVFWFNRFLDFVFLVDMICQFLTVPQHLVPELEVWAVGGNPSPAEADEKVSQLKRKIRANYLVGWFAADLTALLPYDLIAYLIEKLSGTKANTLRLLRIVRLLRIGKVLRVAKANNLIARYDDRVGIDFTKYRIFTDMFLLIVLAHWSACAFRFVVLIEGDHRDESWIFYYFQRRPQDVPNSEIYNVALYWAIESMSSVGYGDVLPQTQAEVLVCSLVMVLGVCCMAFMLGSITSLMSSLDIQSTEYYSLRAQLDVFLVNANIPSALAMRLRNYFRSQYVYGGIYDFSPVLSRLTDQLRKDVSTCIQSSCLNASPFFCDGSASVLSLIASVMEQRSMGKGERLISLGEDATTLYFVRRGLVIGDSSILCQGDMFGEDMLYFAVHEAYDLLARPEDSVRPQWRGFSKQRQYNVTSVSFGLLNVIKHDGILKVLTQHPEFLQRVQAQVVRYTFRMHMLAYTRAYRLVYEEEVPRTSGSRIAGSRALEEWYTHKLQMTQTYEGNEKFAFIVRIQTRIRGFLGRLRFRRYVREGLADPATRHRHLKQHLERMEARLDQLERTKYFCESSSDEEDLVSSQEFIVEWKRMKVYYKEKLRSKMRSRSMNNI